MLQVILMSATLDAGLFAQYFGSAAGSGGSGVPTLAAGGRTFPVQQVRKG
jgi:HrpA-like RNA helicase